ncbi:MAG: TldD/PmbA family protein [Candidatus Hodarchaeota archaeon]
MMNDHYKERVEYILTKAESDTFVKEVEVFLGVNRLLTIRSATTKILESKVIQDAGVALRLITKDNCMGFSSTCDFSDQSLRNLITEAIALAKYRKINPNYSFTKPTQTSRKNKFYDPKLIEAIHEYEDLNEQVNQMLLEAKSRNKAITESGGPVHLVEFHKHIRNTNGLNISEKGTYWEMELIAIAESSTDRREGSDSRAGWQFADISTSSMSEHAAQMAVDSLGGKPVETGEYEIILSPTSVSTFLGWLNLLTQPQNQEKNMPLLRDKIGEQVVSTNLTVGNDPLKIPCPVSGSFDDEGVPTRDIILFKDGIFQEMPLDNYYANKFDISSNGTGYRIQAGSGMTSYPGQLYQSEPVPLTPAPYMEGGDSNTDEMVAETKRGIYLDFLHYAYIINGSTGDYTGILRQGTFLIEKGEITHPIKKCRLMDNIISMAKGIELVGKSRMAGHWGTFMHVPPVKVTKVNVMSY